MAVVALATNWPIMAASKPPTCDFFLSTYSCDVSYVFQLQSVIVGTRAHFQLLVSHGGLFEDSCPTQDESYRLWEPWKTQR